MMIMMNSMSAQMAEMGAPTRVIVSSSWMMPRVV